MDNIMNYKYKAYAYDYDKEGIVKFDSEQNCCSSCNDDQEYENFDDDPCCCVHQLEYIEKYLGV
jgi:hypothetical protein